MADPVIDPHETVTVEDDKGRILSGSGVSEESLTAVVDKEAPAQPELVPQPEKEPKGRARYSKLTAEREAALTEAQAAKALADELKNRLALLEAREAERAQQAQKPDLPPQEPQYTRPEPSEAEIGTKYQDYPAFVRDLARWVAENELIPQLQKDFDAKLEARIEADKASSKQRDASQSIVDRGRAVYPDFDTVVGGCQTKFHEGILQAILKLPDAEHIEYKLGSDPDFAARVAAAPDGVTLGRILAEVVPSTGRAVPASRPVVARTSQAPPPYEPVAGGSPTSAPPLADLADKGDFEAYKARRASELRSAGGVTAHR